MLRNLRDERAAVVGNARTYGKLKAQLKSLPKYGNDLTKSLRAAGQNLTSITVPNEAPITAGFLVQGLRGRLDALRKFRADLDKLRGRGLSTAALHEIEQSGVEEGGAYAAALVAGSQGQIDEVNRLRGQIGNQARRTGNESVAGLIQGVRGQLRQVDKIGVRLARRLRTAVKRELGIRSPSRRLRQDGVDTARGLALGIGDEARNVERAALSVADRVAGAMTPTLADLAGMANGTRLAPVARVDSVVTIRHEVSSPDGSISRMTAEQVADLIARDPKAARALERILRATRARKARNTVAASR